MFIGECSSNPKRSWLLLELVYTKVTVLTPRNHKVRVSTLRQQGLKDCMRTQYLLALYSTQAHTYISTHDLLQQETIVQRNLYTSTCNQNKISKMGHKYIQRNLHAFKRLRTSSWLEKTLLRQGSHSSGCVHCPTNPTGKDKGVRHSTLSLSFIFSARSHVEGTKAGHDARLQFGVHEHRRCHPEIAYVKALSLWRARQDETDVITCRPNDRDDTPMGRQGTGPLGITAMNDTYRSTWFPQ